VIVLVLFLSLSFTPINKRLLRWVDEKFYPERTKYTASLRQLIQNVSGYIESGALLSHLAEWIKNTTGIRNIVPVVFDGQLSLSGIPFTIGGQNSVINRVKDGNKFFWDEISDKSRIPVNESEFEWALDNEISVTIPMISQGELMGLLNIGRKENYEDYTAEDLDILTQASNQAALALQNIKLQSEYLDKKRIDKEMEVARNIQKQLMPQEIPNVQGLDIYGESRPCNEVAGDYFDIINMEDGNSVLVVADVSGKGAGAAIIMANLQASIRLGIHLSDKLADFVARINNLIHVNTSSAEFITFFMAIWDPKTRVLYYVNAGHNPPILIDKDNNVTKLDATGLIIGVLPNQQYEEKYVRIKEGDALVIYTDGLDEARNDKEDFYGLERIISNLIANKNLSSKEIIDALNQDAVAFCNGVPLHDDVTLIAAKGV
jgi:sigma-B regulation protein RsbU (phosphoserine phosphatase)